ncbi:POK19 protein, partial [Loxia curvirostra]|nr:POK19 protein [Loxia curvirostra]
EGSPQIAELAAIVRAFQKFQQPLNLVTDSAYVAGIAERAEHALLKRVQNNKLFGLLSELVWLLSHREQPYHITHIRSHTDLPGPITEGNRMADHLAMTATTSPTQRVTIHALPDIFQQAQLSHKFYHQNAPALTRQFKISVEQARAIVATCPNCQAFSLPSMPVGVNPRSFGALELWQTDITHYTPFGRLKFIHVSIDTFSRAVFASAHAGEKAHDVIKHFYMAFATLGVPKAIKTDNGPAFTSKRLKEFTQQWGISHTTGIPHNPTGQSIVEQAHKEIKSSNMILPPT